MNMDLLTQLAQNGLLALLLAISYGAVGYLFLRYKESQKQNDDLQEKRIADYKEMSDKYARLADEFKATLSNTISLFKDGKHK